MAGQKPLSGQIRDIEVIVVGVLVADANDAEWLRVPRSRARVRAASELLVDFDVDILTVELLRDLEPLFAF